MTGYYLYGLLLGPGPDALDLLGIDQHPVQLHALDEFNFIHSHADRERYRTSRQNLLTHEKVLEQLMHQGFTVLPLRFGLVAASWEQVELDLLVDHREDLRALFIKLDGMREVGVKVYWEPDQELQQLAQHHPQVRAQRETLSGRVLTMDETIAVGRLVESALDQQQQQIAQHFNQQLDPLARAIQDNDLMSREMIYNRAFLIPWDQEPIFDQAVEVLGAHYGDRLRIRYNNFTAPYNFAILGER